jgi:hypothetical protein
MTDAERSHGRSEILIAIQDAHVAARLSVALSHTGYDLTVVHGRHAFQAARASASDSVVAMILGLDGRETPLDLRDLFNSLPGCAFILLVAEMPPRSAVARIADEARAAILPVNEAAIVIEATVVAMLGARSSVS